MTTAVKISELAFNQYHYVERTEAIELTCCEQPVLGLTTNITIRRPIPVDRNHIACANEDDRPFKLCKLVVVPMLPWNVATSQNIEDAPVR